MSLFDRRAAASPQEVEAFEDALESGYALDPSTADLLAIARALRVSTENREAARDATQERMMRAFELAGREATGSAGSRDARAESDVPDVFTARVDLPDGGRVVLADVERIDADRIAKATSATLHSVDGGEPQATLGSAVRRGR